MDSAEFIGLVAQATGDDRELALRAIRATLETLAERLGLDEAGHLAAQLDPELGAWLHPPGPAKTFDADEFVRRVAEREQVDPERAERHAAAVFIGLARAVSEAEFAHVRARLSRDYAPLMPKGPFAGTGLSAAQFVADVAERTGLDATSARTMTEAVLETFAERIAPGDVEDLLARLPLALRSALKRGAAYTDAATAFPADEFLHRVAVRSGVRPNQARSGARAVLAALRRALPAEEFADITAQLPEAYRTVLGV